MRLSFNHLDHPDLGRCAISLAHFVLGAAVAVMFVSLILNPISAYAEQAQPDPAPSGPSLGLSTHRNSDLHTKANGHADTQIHAEPDSDPDPDADSYAGPHSDAFAYPNSDADAHVRDYYAVSDCAGLRLRPVG